MVLGIRRGGDVLLLVATRLLVALLIEVARPVAGPVAVGAMAASLAEPLTLRFARAIGGRTRLAAFVVTTVATLAVAAPLAIVTYLAIVQLVDLGLTVSKEGVPLSGWGHAVTARLHLPLGTLEGLIGEGARRLLPVAQALAAKSIELLIGLLLLAATLYALLAEGRQWLRALARIPPFDSPAARLFVDEFHMVARSVLLGTYLTALLHGVAGWAGFELVRLPRGFLWGAVMTVASLIPGVGTALVWGPAAGVLVAEGHWIRAVLLVTWGVLVMGAIDYVVRPMLARVGFGAMPRGGNGQMRLPEYGMLVSMVGGVAAFGLVGLFIGPMVTSLALVALSVMRRTARRREPPI